jgi:hypothetical protein
MTTTTGTGSETQSFGFVAYPVTSKVIEDAIDGAAELARSGALPLRLWKAMKTIGYKVDDVVRESIDDAAVLIAEITYPNPNVFYEIGAAIGRGKPVIPMVNLGIEKAVQRIQATGLFDTIGWATYTNARELHEKLCEWPTYSWSSSYTRRQDHSQPLFILDTLIKTDFRNHIFHAVENSHLRYRSFDPTEVPRLTAAQAIAQVSSSAGVIIPIIAQDIVDAELNNLRASFILGLCHGFSVEALAIQYGNGPAPLDYREFITNSTFRRETENHVEKFAAEVLIWNQNASVRDRQLRPGLLSEIDLGSPTAENETQKLGYYFVQTAEFSRALRAEGAVVTGRKGSGKSAAYLQIVDSLSRNRRTCIVDLRPASHNLSEMREAILGVVTAGVFDHTIAAFWLYIMYVEILLKLREMVLPRSRNNFALQERIRDIEKKFSLSESVVSGDFTSRLETVVRDVIAVIHRAKVVDDVRQHITNAMFEQPIPQLRDAVASFTDIADEVVVLIDDLDRGWPPRQVENQDVNMVKHLIEALNRIRRDLGRRKVRIRHLVFLRSDVYEQLVQETSDRGKYNVIKVDWSDPDQLRHLLRQRVISNVDSSKHEEAWDAINPPLSSGDAVSVMIESSLRRPRFLIDLSERTLSCAINRGHTFVTESDVDEGLRQMSLYLVSDFAYEMRDIAGTPENIFYLFIGADQLLTEEELANILSTDQLGLGIPETIDLLTWYGFLGFMGTSGATVYIYDVAYDFRRLEAERALLKGDVLYVVNPAFLKGLARTGV